MSSTPKKKPTLLSEIINLITINIGSLIASIMFFSIVFLGASLFIQVNHLSIKENQFKAVLGGIIGGITIPPFFNLYLIFRWCKLLWYGFTQKGHDQLTPGPFSKNLFDVDYVGE
jgi:hypothetical protein